MAEISDDALRVYQTAHAVLDRLIGNPKTKAAVEKMIKEQFPQAGVQTSQDMAEPIISPLMERLEKIESRFKKEDDDRLDNQLKEAFKRMKDSGFTDDGIERVKKMMVDRNIADPEAAAALWEKQNPAPAVKPTGIQPSGWTIPGQEEEEKYKKLVENEDAFAREEAAAVLNEFAANGENV